MSDREELIALAEPLAEQVWEHLKQICAADPAKARRIVMVNPLDVRLAVAAALRAIAGEV